MTAPRARWTGLALTAAAAGIIGYFTLRPGGGGPHAVIPGGYLGSDVVLNILLFIPLGVGLALSGVRSRWATLLGGLASGAIELAQLWWIPGRYASLHDLVTNTGGTAIGVLIVAYWAGRARWWRALSPWVAGVILAAWIAGAFLLRTAYPTERWYGQWAYVFRGTAPFGGRLLALSMQEMPLPDGRLDATPLFRERARLADTLRIEARIVTASPPAGRAQIYAIVAGRSGEIASIWQEGEAIVARQRLGLSEAGLRTPWIRLDSAFQGRSGDTVTVGLAVSRRTIELTVRGDRISRGTRMQLTPDLFWSAFLPVEYQGGDGVRWWPLVPATLAYLGLGLALGGRPLVLGGATAVTLLAGPLLLGTAWPDAALLAAAALGPTAGAWLSGALGLRQRA